jgi:hypothetical protein
MYLDRARCADVIQARSLPFEQVLENTYLSNGQSARLES